MAIALSSEIHEKRDRTIMGWLAILSEYSFTVFHLKSEENELADLASRVQQVVLTAASTEEEIQRALEEAHSIGHFGANVMYYHITVTQERNNIPKLLERCLEFTQSCEVCRKINTHRVGYSPLKEPRQLLPNGRWHLDVIHMGTSASGNNYILTVVDEFTRYVWVKAMEHKDASSVAKHLSEIGCSFGFPADVKSDQGGEFNN